MIIVLALMGYVAYRLTDRDRRSPFDGPTWHEPLDSWSEQATVLVN